LTLRPTGRFLTSVAALIAAALWLARPALAQQPGTVTGQVVSESTGVPLEGAQVTITGTPLSATVGADGRFTITGVAPGAYTVEVTLAGYIASTAEVTVPDAATAQAAPELTILLADDPSYGEVIVIVGSRTERSVTQSPSPIDVISSDLIEQSGQAEANQLLAVAAPSYNATHQTIADGSDHVNPASLRGLGPGQVLVLINGKRRHASALMHVNGTFGRGTVGVDLNAIPTSAIQRIEVLRDGASAQYGSDAIAGVINIVLKDYKEVLTANAQTGITAFGDGFELKLGGNYGVPLGEGGVFNITGEFLQRSPTNRAGPWEGNFFPGVTNYEQTTEMLRERGLTREDVKMDVGQSGATVGALMFNAKVPLGAGELYSFGGGSYRDGVSAGFYRRLDQQDRTFPEIYPNGFLPEIHTTISDWSGAVGYRQEIGSIDLDASLSHGGNYFGYTIENSINASLGPDSPTSGYAGGSVFDQTTANIDAVTEIPVPSIRKLALAAGAEYRLENFVLRDGQEHTWVCGPEAPARPCGIQVFPGFRPENAVSELRHSTGVYVGAESELVEGVFLDAAGRFEYFNDFGATVNGKLAARWNIWDFLGLRAGASTGFRAPALHQIWFSTISTQFVGEPDPMNPGQIIQVPKQVLTATNESDVARAFGIPSLEEETSMNVSGGVVSRPLENLSITLDAYRIDIDDRIVLTSRFADNDPVIGEQVRALLDMAGGDVSQAQFFTNAVDTNTTGLDVVADYSMGLAEGTLGLTLSGNFTRTKVERINVPSGVAANFAADIDTARTIVFNREEENRLEDAVPRVKTAFSARYGLGPVTSLLRATYYGDVKYKPVNPALDETFDPKLIFDLDLGYQLGHGLKVSVGALNLLNTMPDEHRKDANRNFEQFIYSRAVSQYGINGGFYYLRLQYLM
jgi:iron complex outermembrane receptor protein